MGFKVNQHQISKNDSAWDYCVTATTASSALYNLANNIHWDSWNHGHGFISQPTFDKMLKGTVEYSGLPAKVSQLVLKQVSEGWTTWFKALKDWKVHPEKYKGKPFPPKRNDGLNLIKFNNQAVSKVGWKKGFIQPSMSPLSVSVLPDLKLEDLSEVRLIPKKGYFVLETVYDDGLEDWKLTHKGLGAALDLGLDNLAMITFSNPTIKPIAISGTILKSINQWANKQNAKYRSLLNPEQSTSHKLQAIWRKRNNQVKNFLHHATKRVVDELDDIGVTCVGIGKNVGWKDSINIGRVNNQKFVTIPHARFIDMLTRKLEAVGITVKVGEESYTSRASFMDWDSIPTYQPGKTEKPKFSGNRTKTKSYRAKDGSLINADVNGSLNIGRKVIPNYFGSKLRTIVEQDSGNVVAFPRRVNPMVRLSQKTKLKDMSGSAHI
jgi:putative transposase